MNKIGRKETVSSSIVDLQKRFQPRMKQRNSSISRVHLFGEGQGCRILGRIVQICRIRLEQDEQASRDFRVQ